MSPDLKFLLLASLIFPLRTASKSMPTALTPFSLASLARGGLKNREIYDLCSHPFHSWRCSSASIRGGASFNPADKQVKNNTGHDDLEETSGTPLNLNLPLEVESKRVDSNVPTLGRSNFKKSFSLATKFLSTTSSPITGGFVRTVTPLKINIPESSFKQLKESFTISKIPTNQPNRFDVNTSTQKPSSSTTLSGRSTNNSPVKKLLKTSKEKYSKCSHPFHAWLCAKATGSFNIQSSPVNVGISLFPQPKRKISRVLTTTSTVPPTVPTTIPQTVPTTVSTTTTKPPRHQSRKEQSYHMCSHAYHSWLCRNTSTPSKPKRIKLTSNPIPSFQKPKALTIPFNMQRNTAASKPKIKDHLYSKCKHSFHSWLCGRTSEPKQEKEGISLPSASSLPHPKTNNRRLMNTTTTKRDCHTLLSLVDSFKLDDTSNSPLTNTNSNITETLPLLWKACFKNKSDQKYSFCPYLLDISKCLDKSKSINNNLNFKSYFSKPSASKQPSQTPRIQMDTVKEQIGSSAINSNKESQSKEKSKGWNHSNPCSHAFHSWICRSHN